MFCIVGHCVRKHQDVGEKCVQTDNHTLALSDPEKKVVWKSYYERLLNGD